MPLTPALGRLKHEDSEFKASTGYRVKKKSDLVVQATSLRGARTVTSSRLAWTTKQV